MGKRRNTNQSRGRAQNRHETSDSVSAASESGWQTSDTTVDVVAGASGQNGTKRQSGAGKPRIFTQQNSFQNSRQYIGGRVSPQPPAAQPTEWQVAHGVPSETVREDSRRRQLLEGADRECDGQRADLDPQSGSDEVIAEADDIEAAHDSFGFGELGDVDEEAAEMTDDEFAPLGPGLVELNESDQTSEEICEHEPTDTESELLQTDHLDGGDVETETTNHDNVEELTEELGELKGPFDNESIVAYTSSSQEGSGIADDNQYEADEHGASWHTLYPTDVSDAESDEHTETAVPRAWRDHETSEHEASEYEESDLGDEQPRWESETDSYLGHPENVPDSPDGVSISDFRGIHSQLFARSGSVVSDDLGDNKYQATGNRQKTNTKQGLHWGNLLRLLLIAWLSHWIINNLFYRNAGSTGPLLPEMDSQPSVSAVEHFDAELFNSKPGTINLVDLTLHTLSGVTAVARYEDVLVRIDHADSAAALAAQEAYSVIKPYLRPHEYIDEDRQNMVGQWLNAYFQSRTKKVEVARKLRSKLHNYRISLKYAYQEFFDDLLVKIPIISRGQGNVFRRLSNGLCNALVWNVFCDHPAEKQRRDALLAFVKLHEASDLRLLTQVKLAKEASKDYTTTQLMLLNALGEPEAKRTSFTKLSSIPHDSDLATGLLILQQKWKKGLPLDDSQAIFAAFDESMYIGWGEHVVYSWMESQLERAIKYWDVLKSELEQDPWGEQLYRSWDLEVLRPELVERSNALNRRDLTGVTLSHWDFFGGYLAHRERAKVFRMSF